VGLAGSTEAVRRHLVVSLVLFLAIFVAGLAQPERGDGSPERTRVRTALPALTTTTTAPGTTLPPPTTLAPFSPPPAGTTGTTPRVRPTTTTTATVEEEESAPPPSAPLEPCGGSVAKAGGGQWQCTWSDEFDGSTLDRSKWTVQETSKSGFHSGQECFVDTPNNISLADGTLRLTVRYEGHDFACAHRTKGFTTAYTSGMVMTYGKFTQAFGRFEVRAKVPAVRTKGLQTAFWMWPEDGSKYGSVWPQSGEIDIAEIYSLRADRAVPFIHYISSDNETNTRNDCLIDDVSQFHTYTLEWTREAMTILYDGVVCIQHRWRPVFPQVHPQPFDQPFMLALTQALGVFGNAFDGSAPLPATTTVDYVRVWK